MKKFQKFSVGVGASVAVIAPIAVTVSCSLFDKGSSSRSSYEFFNYEAYMADSVKNNISQTFDYTEFGDLPELEQGIRDERVGAGIGSDYFNASLAGKGLISKIDFSRLFGITNDQSQWADILGGKTGTPGLYTPEVWKLLSSFEITKLDDSGNPVLDSSGAVIHDVDGDGSDDYLWEYMAPYFIQNKVVGVNISRLASKTKDASLKAKLVDSNGKVIISQNNFQKEIESALGSKPLTYKNILDQLKVWGASNLGINDYVRDNMMIGSENTDGTFFSGDISSSNYKQYFNNFANNVTGGWNKTWKTSGVVNLETLLDNGSTEGKNDVALMYNGDALYAYNGGDEEINEGTIRSILPMNPTFLLDGMVIPNYVNNDYSETDKVYKVLSQYLFRGATFSNAGTSAKTAAFTSNNELYNNFEFVGYTAAFNSLNEYIKSEEFKDENAQVDQDALSIYDSVHIAEAKIDDKHITKPIENNLNVLITDYNLTHQN